MNTIECPNCLTKIFPTNEGNCPSCKTAIRSYESENQVFTSLDVHELAKQPKTCFNCGKTSDSYLNFNKKTKTGGDHWFLILLTQLISAIPIIDTPEQKIRTRINLPTCSQCKRSNRNYEPTYINFQESKMTFKVHKRFKEEYLKLNN